MGNIKGIFTENLIEICEARGITQAELADILGLQRSVVNAWFKGLRFPRIEMLEQLAELLKVEISELLTETTDPCLRELGMMFKAQRERLGYTEYDVAIMSGVGLSGPEIACFENGKRVIGTYKLVELARFLQLDIDRMFVLAKRYALLRESGNLKEEPDYRDIAELLHKKSAASLNLEDIARRVLQSDALKNMYGYNLQNLSKEEYDEYVREIMVAINDVVMRWVSRR